MKIFESRESTFHELEDPKNEIDSSASHRNSRLQHLQRKITISKPGLPGACNSPAANEGEQQRFNRSAKSDNQNVGRNAGDVPPDQDLQ